MAETIWCLFIKGFICPTQQDCMDGPCPHMTKDGLTVIVKDKAVKFDADKKVVSVTDVE